MVPIARRNLFQEKLRLIISAGGVALAVLLILLLDSLLVGMYRQISTYLDYTPGELFVAKEGVANLQGAASSLPARTTGEIESVRGVRAATPIIGQYAIVEVHNKKITTFMIGFDPQRGGGPWKLVEGRLVRRNDEVVVDAVLARRHGLHLGDHFKLLGRDFTIVGLSDQTSSWMVSLVFVTLEAALDLLLAPDNVSFILVQVDNPEESQATLAEVRRRLPKLSVLTKTEVAANDVRLLAQVFSTPLRLMVGVAFFVGALVVGLTIYSATVEKFKEYGVLKAIGMRNWRLYRIVVEQAVVTAALGFLGGAILLSGATRLIQQAAPQFLVLTVPELVMRALGLTLLMALVAAYVPARYVAGIDPASVFRG